MPIIFNNSGTILFRNNGIAMDPSCCCGNGCCCSPPEMVGASSNHIVATFAAPGCTGALDGFTMNLNPDFVNSTYPPCARWLGSKSLGSSCGTAVPTIQLTLQCNTSLSDRSGGSCDKYELKIVYQASPCTALTTFYRVNEGCSCSPFNLVFTLPGPSWNGVGLSDCNCCGTPPSDITVTITE